jgi:ribosomal protein S18 acetylase RimI-like enzyme
MQVLVDWAAAEGWNPGLQDADCFHAADPDGFLIGYQQDVPVACISAVRYSADFGFIGFYIVRPDSRGQGCGMQVWRAAMERLNGCNIGLDGVVEQQTNYRKSGFQLAYRNIRYAGVTGADAPQDSCLVELPELPFAKVAAYDAAFFPAPRSGFIQSWIEQPGSVALGYLDGGELRGYGVIRRCLSGYKIGPLFADDAEIAEWLFLSLQARAAKHQPVFLDVPEVNPAALALAERHAMTVSFETARMYTGQAPELPLAKTFGVTSFELG